MTKLLEGLKSRHPNHALQPSEIHTIASLITIYEAANGRKPDKKELRALWEEHDK